MGLTGAGAGESATNVKIQIIGDRPQIPGRGKTERYAVHTRTWVQG